MSVMVVYGNCPDLILMREQEVVQEYRANGYEVRYLSDKEGVLEDVFSSGLFDVDPVLVVVHNPTKVKGLKDYLSDTRGYEVLAVHGNDRLPKLLGGHPYQELNEPKYDDQKVTWAADFLHNYIKRMGKKIDPKLCIAVVQKSGTDVGVLRWEAHKYVMAVGDSEEIPAKIIAGLYSELSDRYSSDLVNSVASCDPKFFLKVCARMEKSSSKDLTMSVCNGLLFYKMREWVDVAVRLDAKESLDDIAHDLGVNPWKLTNILVPQIKSMGLVRIRKLLRALYEAEDAVLRGSRGSWEKLKSGILRAMQ
jgi:DNA polymerase III delta subunit